MSRTASLRGAELFSRKSTFFKRPLVPGSFAAWGRTFGRKLCFFLKKPLVPGSFAAWGRTFFQKSTFLKKPLVPSSFAAWGRTFLVQKCNSFWKKPLVRGSFAAQGRTVFQKCHFLWKKPLIPGSFAAWSRCLFQKLCFFERTGAAAKGAECLLGGSGGRSPLESRGVRGAQPPRLPPPKFEPNL